MPSFQNVTLPATGSVAGGDGIWRSNDPTGATGGGGTTITGTGFGTKPSTTPYFEDFESQTVGSAVSPVGSLTVSNGTGTSISSTVKYSGTKSLEQDFSSNSFPKIYKTLSGTEPSVYMAGYFKFNGAGGTVWKHARIGAGTVYSGDPKAGSSYTATQGANVPSNFSGEMKTKSPAEFTGVSGNNTGADVSIPAEGYITDTWLFYEAEFYAGTLDNSNSYFSETVEGKQTLLWNNLEFLDSTAPDLPDWFLTVLNGHDGTNTLKMYMDTVYIDESRCRVVMTDNAVYASSTKWAVQPVVTWSDTSITYTAKRQGFAISSTAYLHAFDNDGALVYSGSSFTVVEDI
jgi:hypothetical protein